MTYVSSLYYLFIMLSPPVSSLLHLISEGKIKDSRAKKGPNKQVRKLIALAASLQEKIYPRGSKPPCVCIYVYNIFVRVHGCMCIFREDGERSG